MGFFVLSSFTTGCARSCSPLLSHVSVAAAVVASCCCTQDTLVDPIMWHLESELCCVLCWECDSLVHRCSAAAGSCLWWQCESWWCVEAQTDVSCQRGGGLRREGVLVVGLICLWGTGAAARRHRHNKSYVTQKPRPRPTSQDSGKRRWRLIRTENLCHQYAFTSAVSLAVKPSVKPPPLLLCCFLLLSFKW